MSGRQFFASDFSTIQKKIAECSIFADFRFHYTKPGSPHGGLFKGGGLYVESISRVGTYPRGRLAKGVCLIECLRY